MSKISEGKRLLRTEAIAAAAVRFRYILPAALFDIRFSTFPVFMDHKARPGGLAADDVESAVVMDRCRHLRFPARLDEIHGIGWKPVLMP